MNRLTPLAVAVSLLFGTQLAHAASDVPAEFADLFKIEKKQIKFKDIEGRLHSLEVEAGYDTVKITAQEQLDKVAAILERNHVSQQYIDKILFSLQQGQKNQSQCEGLISECIILPEEFEFLFDYYTSTLYLYVNTAVLTQKAEETDLGYASPIKEGFSGINHFNTYLGKTDSTDIEYSIYDETIIGLPVGNIRSDFQYQSANDDFELNELIYNYEYNNKRLTLGLTRDTASFNNTSLLLTSSLNKELSVNFGSSKNLLLGSKNKTQQIFYFAPSAGLLTVYRGERIVLQKNVEAGQGYFTNEQLPRGRYDVVVQVESNGQVTSREVHSIYNIGAENLATGDIDYLVSAGQYQKTFERFGDQDGLYSQYDGQYFSRALAVYRPLDWLTVGSGLALNESENSLTLGTKMFLPFDSDLTSNIQIFDDGAVYSDTFVKVYKVTASYSQLNSADEVSLANYLYGTSNFKRGSLSSSINLFDRASGYLSYSYTKQDETELSESFEQSIVSASVNFNTIANSTVDFSVDYDLKADDSLGRDKLLMQLTWTVPLSQDVTVQTQLYSGESSINQFSTRLQSGDLAKNNRDFYASVQAGHNYYANNLNSTSFDVSANGNYIGPKYNANAYSYADNHGQYNINTGISSSQVITSQGTNFTSAKADSYLVVNTDNRIIEDSDRDEKGMLVLENNGRIVNKRILYDDNEVIPVREYRGYSALIDVESLDLFNSGQAQGEYFAHPGSVLNLNSRITRIISFVSGFKDVFDNRLTDVSCFGTGCVRQENITSGIYKFSVMEGLTFSLKNNDLICLIPAVEDTELFNFGNNYCLPNIQPTEQYITYEGDHRITLTFIGGYDLAKNKQLVEQYINDLAIPADSLITKVVNNHLFVYYKNEDFNLSKSQQDILKQLTYIANNDVLDKINAQHALVKR
ncbi:TcfC E-set like domain-containing protein [Pseudoalteromonas haloplanktis]|uniref:TcfC E-set like domain-containing protein n=1 Tax=Pseudoalteromonas haloplanktis TaxID=228 RepID=A0ABU1BBJ6_PSEHA|nr:TcfC E-set like domain-containing protein [Pseudoalteromonas haloplanktis]MDQ9091299.1 TcfC E-set like domain-containing protein [Pseudoalteromonas haloplanktis]